MQRRNVVVVGCGAVGSYFGGLLSRKECIDVSFVTRREKTVDEIRQNQGLQMNCVDFSELVPIHCTTDMQVVRDASLILLSVKVGVLIIET